jgi:GTP cyclohydrolase I
MDAIANLRSIASELPHSGSQVSRSQAEEAVRTLIRWAGDDPGREGLLETPSRVARAYREWFGGYEQDPAEHLERTFEEIGTYSGPILLRDIPFHSVCEHHMAPIRGVCHVSYLPQAKVVGISKLARVVETIASRLQIQERLTAEIAETIDRVLRPRGVAVAVEAEHACMSARGIRKQGITMETLKMIGAYVHDSQLRTEFLVSVRGSALPQPR